MSDEPPVLWRPSPEQAQMSTIARFARFVTERTGVDVGAEQCDYDALWRWSTADIDGFWSELWAFFRVVSEGDLHPVRVGPDMAGTRWFPRARLNWAEQALGAQWDDDAVAVVAASQTRSASTMTMGTLRQQVARARAGLVAQGVGPGDRVAAYLPNIPETLVALLATASLGATWSSCAPEFGVRSVVDRFGQIEPKVLLAVDGYRYGDRVVDRTGDVADIRRSLPGLAATVMVPYLDPGTPLPTGTMSWDELLADSASLEFLRVPFDHPLYVLFSSGTTGLPKPIVHGHGGMVLAHLRDLCLQQDIGAGDRFLWFTTTGWMMWNYLVSGLMAGAGVVLFDGDPGADGLTALWRLVQDAQVTVFGTSAPFLMACRRAGLHPASTFDLSRVRQVASTGAPLPPAGYQWVAEEAAPGVPLACISGGTDVCSVLVGQAPTLPVWSGEMSCRVLGAAVAAFDADGHPVVGDEGEMVVTEPLPSMPVGLWGDSDGSRYRATYFERYPGVWHHGDRLTITTRGSCIISGRSDATLNRGGVRIGTAELYAVVEARSDVADSLAVHLEDDQGGPGLLVLFVVPADGCHVDEAMRGALGDALRRSLSPRHVPDRILEVPAIPRTLSGKKLEVPVKRILQGADPATVVAAGALANPESLAGFVALASALR